MAASMHAIGLAARHGSSERATTDCERGQGVSRITVATIDLQRERKRRTYLLRPGRAIGALLATARNAEQSTSRRLLWPANGRARSIAASMTAATARGINERRRVV